MAYIGHSPTNAGTFYILDDITIGSGTTYGLAVGGVSVSPSADNLLITLDGVIQHPTDAYTVSGSNIVFASGPGSGVEFYGIIMGQSASTGQGSIGADELKVSGDGSSGQVLVSDGDGTFSWATDTENYLPLAGGTMSGAINLGSQNVTNGGTITGTFVGNITGNVTGNASGTALTVTQAAQTAITSVGTSLTVGTVADEGDAIITNGADGGRYDVLTVKENGNARWNLSFEGSGATNSLTLNSNSTSNVLVLDNATGNATFAGNIAVNGTGSDVITGDYLYLDAADNSAAKNLVFRQLNDTWMGQIEFSPSGTSQIVTRVNQPLAFGVNNSQKMTIETSGAIKSTGGMYFTGNALSGNDTGINASADGGDLRLMTNGTNRMTVQSDGKVGIGCAPDEMLHVISDSKFDGTIRVGDGSAAAPSYRFINDVDTGIYWAGTNAMGFVTGGTSRMELRANGSLVIDQNSNELSFKIDSEATTADTVEIDASTLTSGRGLLMYSNSDRDTNAPLAYVFDNNGSNDGDSLHLRNDGAGDYLRCYNEGNVHFKISITGDVTMSDDLYFNGSDANAWIIGKTSGSGQLRIQNFQNLRIDGNEVAIKPPSSASANFYLQANGSNDARINFATQQSGTFWSLMMDHSDSQKIFFVDENGNDGVYMDTNNTSWQSNSDERMKENLVELDGALANLNTLRCVNFNMKHDKDNKRIGLIAQDVYKIYPEATSGSPDSEYSFDESRDGNSHKGAMGLRYSEMIPPMIKAIQELSAEVEKLKGN